MYKLLRIALFAAPLAGGVAWAQASGTSGSAGAPGTITPPVTNDTRTPLQQKAGRLDDTQPVLPGDATKPADVPTTNKESDRAAMPDTRNKADESTLPRKSDVDHDTTRMQNDTTRMQNKVDSDLKKDQLDSDK